MSRPASDRPEATAAPSTTAPPAAAARPSRWRPARRVAALLAVLLATFAGAAGGLFLYHDSRTLSVGEIALSVSPAERGALTLYVPLVDWGVRFEAIPLPVSLDVDLRTVNRDVVTAVASGEIVDVAGVRSQAETAIRSFLLDLLAVSAGCGLLLGLLVSLAVRHHGSPRVRWMALTAGVGTVASTLTLVLGLPPRGTLAEPVYFAHGPDIPRALQAVEDVTRSSKVLDAELNSQLVGLARLVLSPGRRSDLQGRPRFTIASDLHNNVLSIPILDRIAGGSPVLFPGDLTDRGTPLETTVTRQVVGTGKPFVFVTGNHDSDRLARTLVRQGAIVLTQDGRLDRDGQPDPDQVVVTISGVRMAGYSDPFQRLAADDYRDTFGADTTRSFDDRPTEPMQQAFVTWMETVVDRTDVIMVHEPALIGPALKVLATDPPDHPVVFVTGHTHTAAVTRASDVTVVNGGSIGAGGTGNLARGDNDIGVAELYFSRRPFTPLAADLVQIDPGTGDSSARRIRLDAGADVRSGDGRDDADPTVGIDDDADATPAPTPTPTPTPSRTAERP